MSENRKTFKKTNSDQFKKLVEVMEANPDVAKGLGRFGSSKQTQKECWENVAVELNSLGPPMREGREWHKVWLDYKLKLKKKIASNKKHLVATGGGPYSAISLSPLEQAVDALLNLQELVNPSGSSFGAGLSSSQNMNDDRSEEGEVAVESQENATVRNTPSRRINKESAKLKILEDQTATQTDLLTTARSIKTVLTEISRYTRKSYELKKEEIVFMKAKEKSKELDRLEKNRRHKEKMEIKLRQLELKSLKYHENIRL